LKGRDNTLAINTGLQHNLYSYKELDAVTVISEVKDLLLQDVPQIEEIVVERVCLGLSFTGVKLQGGQAGVCHSLLSERTLDCCRIREDAGTLAGQPATAFLGMAGSWDLSDRVIGIATMNALSQIVFDAHPHRYAVEAANLIDVIDVAPQDIVALVGLIRPFVPIFQAKAKEVYILERGGRGAEGTLPDTACEEVLPQADVVVITGSTLANGSIDRLLELAANARIVAVVGPTASSVPDPLFTRRVTYVGGIAIHDADMALQVIAEGGGTPRLRTAGAFITFTAR
jgi:uncharacterized protein (DUF4213/DUF364 family)